MLGPEVIFTADASVIAQTAPSDPRDPPKTKLQTILRSILKPYKPPTRDIYVIKPPNTLGLYMPARMEPIVDLIEKIVRYDLEHNADTFSRILEMTIQRKVIFDLADGEEASSASLWHIDDDHHEIDQNVVDIESIDTSRVYLVTSHGGTKFEDGFVAQKDQVILFGGDVPHIAPGPKFFNYSTRGETRGMLRLAFRDAKTINALFIDDRQIYGRSQYSKSELAIKLVG